jgi:hypothetical protein
VAAMNECDWCDHAHVLPRTVQFEGVTEHVVKCSKCECGRLLRAEAVYGREPLAR